MNTVERIYWLRQEAKALTEEADELVQSLGLTEPEQFADGDYIVNVVRTVRFDPALAKKVLSAEDYAATLVTKPDSTQAKKMLSPETYQKAQREYGLSVRITPVTDAEV